MRSANTTGKLPRPVRVMGVDVTPFASYAQALSCVEEAIDSGRKSFWVAVNPEKVYRAWHDPGVMSVLNEADVGICDGSGVSLAAKLLFGSGLPRCTGCDLFFRLMALAAKRGWGVFLLGASPESNEGACRNLEGRFPGLRVVGRRDGYFRDSADVVEQINASGADLLFVAMGSPKQEYWIAEHRGKLNAAFCLGVGGSFDVASGKTKRAPKVFQRTGTEFLFQLMVQPRRLKRKIVYTPFLLEVLKARVFGVQGVV